MGNEFQIWCDESVAKGKFFSNFYGGVLVRSRDVPIVTKIILDAKAAENFHGEVKWVKMSEAYLEKYKRLMEVFFNLVREDRVKVRVMFTKNSNVPTGLQDQHREKRFFYLYYQFIKHAFGFRHCEEGPANLKVFFDRLPDKIHLCAEFKEFIFGLQRTEHFRAKNVQILLPNDIGEVNSHDHPILQCLDIVLGSMAFRLNDCHLEKLPESRFRGKKTRAKEKLYKHINRQIQSFYPNFNIGASTGCRVYPNDRWLHPYRHWLFEPTQSTIDPTRHK